MKTIAYKNIINKIIIVTIIAIVFNFAIPNYSQAASSDLFKPITQLICGAGDLIIMTLQKVFLGQATISNKEEDLSKREYRIYYSPYNIFAGNIPAMDINFINPSKKNIKMAIQRLDSSSNLTDFLTLGADAKKIDSKTYTQNLFVTKKGCIRNFKKVYGYTETLDITEDISSAKTEDSFDLLGLLPQKETATTQSIESAWYDETNDKVYVLVDYLIIRYYTNDGQTTMTEEGEIQVYEIKAQENESAMSEYNSTFTSKEEIVKVTNKTSGEILQKPVSTWYKNFRIVAIVGLLSVLIYLSIRMILSSTGEDKSKYKKMFVDWLIALCMIFVLQYIMLFTVELVKAITGIIANNSSSIVLQPDELMSKVRKSLAEDPSYTNSFAELIVYIVLVFYACKFTIIYLKRVLTMAFLTAIAPLVALTYPLDKVKDGQAQAFSMWLREYIFNALLQVMHLLLYTILVSSAINLVNENYIYALVAIGFLIPAENLFRKMFGFDKAQTISAVTAATGGAVAMKLMKNLQAKAQKSATKTVNAGNDKNIRTASGPDQMDSSTEAWGKENKDTAEGKIGEKAGEKTGEAAGDAIGSSTGAATGAIIGSIVPGAGTAAGADMGKEIGSEIGKQTGKTVGGKVGKIVGNVVGQARKKITKKAKNIIRGTKVLAKKKFTGKKIAKYLARKTMQAGNAAAFGTVGIAAGIASGDLNKAFKYGAGGIASGTAIGNSLYNKAENGYYNIKNDAEIFKQGYMGTEYEQYLNEKLDKEFMNDPEIERYFISQFENYKQAQKDAIIARQNGITDIEEIKKILKMSYEMNPKANEEERKQNIQKMVNISQLNKNITDEQFNKTSSREDFKKRITANLEKQNLTKMQAQKNADEIMNLLAEFKGNTIQKR